MSIKQKRGPRLLLLLLAGLLFFTILASSATFFIRQASAAGTYIYGGGPNQESLTITGPYLPTGTPNVTFRNVAKGEYYYDAGSDTKCSAYIDTKNGQNFDTDGFLQPSGNPCGSANGKQFPITLSGAGGGGQATNYTGIFINHSTIKVGNDLYIDNKIDDPLDFRRVGGSSCENQSLITGFTHPRGNDIRNATSTVQLALYSVPGGGNQNCNKQSYPIKLSDPNNAYLTYFVWSDSGTIATSDGSGDINSSGAIFIQNNGAGDYFASKGRSVDTKCQSSIAVDANDPTHGTLTLRNGKFYEGWPDAISGAKRTDSNGCGVSQGIPIAIGSPENATKKAGSGGSGDVANGSTATDACQSNGGALAWVICPVIQLMDGAVSELDSAVQRQLETPDPNSLGPQLKEAWGRLRNIALIVLVPIMLVMVIGTAIGVSALDAYTVKRAMPRLLLAIVFISISWYITAFLVNFTNTLGRGILGLITSPFGVANKSLADFIGVQTGATVSYGGLAVFGGLILGGSISFGIVGSIILVALIALFVGFITLTLREIFIFALLLMAPFAILAWIFPNNDKLWKLWWDLFIKLLLMYPLIMLLIGAGKVFASVIPLSRQDNFFTQILVIIAYISPFFFIPATFKYAGGVFANLAGMINDRSKGIFDRQRKYREEERKKLKQNATAGARFNPTNPFIRRFSGSNNKYIRRLNPNRFAEWSAAPIKAASYYGRDRKIPFLNTRGRRIAAEVEHDMMEQSRKYAQHVNTYFNDKASAAVGGMYDSFSDDTKRAMIRAGFATGTVDENGNVTSIKAKGALRSYNDHMKMADILAQSSSDSERKAAEGLRAVAAWTEAQYRNPEMNYMNTAIGAAMHRASHGFFDGKDGEAVGEILEGQGFHTDTINAAVTQAELIGKDGHPENKPGYGHWIDDSGKIRDGMSKESNRGYSVAGTMDAGSLARAKGGVLSMTQLDENGKVIKEGRFGDVLANILNSDPKNPSKRKAVEDKWRKELEASDEFKLRDASGKVTDQVNTAKVNKEIEDRYKWSDNARRGVLQMLTANADERYSYASADVQREAAAILVATGNASEITRPKTPEELAQWQTQHARDEAGRGGGGGLGGGNPYDPGNPYAGGNPYGGG